MDTRYAKVSEIKRVRARTIRLREWKNIFVASDETCFVCNWIRQIEETGAGVR